MSRRPALLLLTCFVLPGITSASDWPRFRGADGAAAAPSENPPVEWDGSRNVLWKAELPGHGASSPITRGEQVFLTAFSGYGEDASEPGEKQDLTLHVLCVDRVTGKMEWDRSVPASEAEQAVTRRVADHGYATGTPVCDDSAVYAYFGVSGLVACSLDGKLLWRAETGTKTAGFGSAASPILFGETVIVNASIECGAVIAFDKRTGDEVWRIDEVKRSWTTPLVARTSDGKDELIISHKDVVRGFDPESGSQLWTCTGVLDYVVPCVVAHDGVAFVLGGRKNQSMAIRLGGRGDVTESHKVWETNIGANVTSPVYHDGKLYWASDRGVANCLDAATGETVYQERLKTRERVYASTLLAGDRLYVTTRENGVFVLALGPEYRELAHNVIEGDDSMYNASPAVSDDQLLLRTNRFLYCIGTK